MKFAINNLGEMVCASNADKSKEYFCLICHNKVTPRQGTSYGDHYAHNSYCEIPSLHNMSSWCKDKLSEGNFSKVKQKLICLLSQFPLLEKDQDAIVRFLRREDDQFLMIHFLYTHPNATAQEILNEIGRIRRLNSTTPISEEESLYVKYFDNENLTDLTDDQKAGIKLVAKDYPDTWREFLRLRFIEKMSYEEIGILYSITKEAVRVKLLKAINLLKQYEESPYVIEGLHTADSNKKNKELKTPLFERPIEQLQLSARAYNALKRDGVSTIGDAALNDIIKSPNVGKTITKEIVEKIDAYCKNFVDDGEQDATQTEQLLVYGLTKFWIKQEDQLVILSFLRKEEDQLLMIDYLKKHPDAREKEIKKEYNRIISASNNKN